MLIQGRRIRSVNTRLGFLSEGQQFVLGIRNPSRFQSTLVQMGFRFPAEFGDTVLPAPLLGAVSRFNAEGREVPLRDQPKEIAYREIVWRWKQWIGGGRTEEKEETRYVPYKRYPRRFDPPPAVELVLRARIDGTVVLVVEPMLFTASNFELIRHTVNLFLEMFGECEVFSEHLEDIVHAPVRRLQWRILPPGQHAWPSLSLQLKPLVVTQRRNQEVLWNRFRAIAEHDPDFVAIGQGGFHGYVVFGFTKLGLYVCESVYVGNATYVFDKQWKVLSQLTKTEVLVGNLYRHRFVHTDGWYVKIQRLLSRRCAA